MSDENCDPTSKHLPTKIRPKPIDARSAAAAATNSFSSIDSPKSATISNVSQRLPSTSVEVSVGEILSTDEKRASVSIREQTSRHHCHSSSSCSSSDDEDVDEKGSAMKKMDLGEATRELTRLLHIGHENFSKEVHLNPDAPDFTPIDFSPTYRSELAPAHLHRRATQLDYYHNRYSRSRYYSEAYPPSPTIRPLLSLVPQYVSHHRQSWTNSNTSPGTGSNSWWQQQDSSNPSSSSSSYHSRPAYPLYSPLMGPLTDDSLYPHRQTSKRQRVHSSRAFVFPTNLHLNRKRSHSGPETPLQPPSTHLNGIHSLTRIMIDILRMIDPIPSEQQKYHRSTDHSNRRRLDEHQESMETETEDVFVDETIPTITERLDSTRRKVDEFLAEIAN